MFLLFVVKLDCKLVVMLFGGLFLGDKFLDFDVFVALEFSLEPLDSHVLAGESFLLELLILDLGKSFGLG